TEISHRLLGRTLTALAILTVAACAKISGPAAPTPVSTANVYILPGAVDLADGAFGDHPIVIFRGEQMRWRNIDGQAHTVVSDTAALPEFATTGSLAPGGEKSFVMNTVGTTTFHCAEHPQMVGTLIVQER